MCVQISLLVCGEATRAFHHKIRAGLWEERVMLIRGVCFVEIISAESVVSEAKLSSPGSLLQMLYAAYAFPTFKVDAKSQGHMNGEEADEAFGLSKYPGNKVRLHLALNVYA